MAAAGNAESICVGVRLRPLVRHERGEKHCLSIAGNTVQITSSLSSPKDTLSPTKSFARDTLTREATEFIFDHAMDSTDPSSPSYVSQAKCYELMAQRMLAHATTGYSSCLICYGQTGTGKTMTIMGNMSPASEQGVLLRLLYELFKDIEEQRSQGFDISFHVQMLEVYNEKVKDLLVRCPCPPGWVCACNNNVDVHSHPKLGVYVKGAVEESVESLAQCVEVIEYGNSCRTVAATAMNAKSSRGHTVFKLKMEKRGGSESTFMASEVFFVDLAGRENEKTTQVTGDRMVELTFINKSLMFLATCIQSLGSVASDPKRKTERKDMSRFRNSKLTLLLSNALSGNSKTSLIGTLSPAAAHFEESLSTLRFASTVKNIKVESKAKSGVDTKSLVASLQEEIKSLKDQITLQASSAAPLAGAAALVETVGVDVEELQRQLESAQALCAEYQRRWQDEHALYEKEKDKRQRATRRLVVARLSMAVSDAKLEKLTDSAPLQSEMQSGDSKTAELHALRSQLQSSNAMCEELRSRLRLGGTSPPDDDSNAGLNELRRQLRSSEELCEHLKAKRRQDKMELAAMRFRLAASSAKLAKLARIRTPSVHVDQMHSMATNLADASGTRPTVLDALYPLPNASQEAADMSAGPQPAGERFPEPIRGYLWKKSPHVLRVARPWDRRYVTLVCGRLSWWIPEEYAAEASSNSKEGGFVDLPCNKCTVKAVDGTSTQLGLHVQGIVGNFTGGSERTFLFDCEGSGRPREEWIVAIKEHVMCRPGCSSSWVADILRSGVLKLISARWLLQQTSMAFKTNHDQLPAAAVIEPADAARLYRESGCLAVLT